MPIAASLFQGHWYFWQGKSARRSLYKLGPSVAEGKKIMRSEKRQKGTTFQTWAPWEPGATGHTYSTNLDEVRRYYIEQQRIQAKISMRDHATMRLLKVPGCTVHCVSPDVEEHLIFLKNLEAFGLSFKNPF